MFVILSIYYTYCIFICYFILSRVFPCIVVLVCLYKANLHFLQNLTNYFQISLSIVANASICLSVRSSTLCVTVLFTSVCSLIQWLCDKMSFAIDELYVQSKLFSINLFFCSNFIFSKAPKKSSYILAQLFTVCVDTHKKEANHSTVGRFTLVYLS